MLDAQEGTTMLFRLRIGASLPIDMISLDSVAGAQPKKRLFPESVPKQPLGQ
jgi:hypothetical protein